MILKRMADALRARDWLGVVLEILIVVIGIYLGLQVDDWNRYRQARALEQEYLERLWVESLENKQRLDRAIERYGEGVDSTRDALEFVLGEEPDAALLARIKEQGLSYGKKPSLVLQDSAYQELVSAGRLGLIRNVELRKALQDVQVALQSHNGQLEYFRNSGLSTRVYELDNFEDLRLSMDDDRGLHGDLLIEKYFGDQKYALTLAQGFEHQIKLRWGVRLIREATGEAMALLACELKKPECGAADSEAEENNQP
ncbi:MAG: hypothetical protein EP347_03760 [Alphaproteobacteria bacterium]|nr:MAG: hypothetical protein EP347_03760 [Alphaproteobacteria bacterium]